MCSIRKTLKEQTGPLHRELDAIVGRYPPFDSERNYTVYLRSMQVLYKRFESPLDWVASVGGMPATAKSILESIESDLSTVPFRPGADPLDSAEAVPFTDSQKWGIAYVMEGSSMGARYMVRVAAEKLSAGVGTCFLQRLALDSKERWPEFVVALDESDCLTGEAIRGAEEAFRVAMEIFANVQKEEEKGVRQ